MPFDGGEFIQFRFPDSLPEPLPATGVRRWRAWMRALLPFTGPEGRGYQPFDRAGEAPSAASLLRAARALIENEGDWAKEAYRTSDGRHCAVGALRTAAARGSQSQYGRGVRREAHGLLLEVARGRGFDSVEKMNDASTHAQVLAAFHAAIAGAEGRRPVAV